MTDQQQFPDPNSPNWLTSRRLNHPETEALEEAYLIQHDIRGCIDAIQIWYCDYASIPDPDRKQNAIGGALFRDAIVQFISCFDNSNKKYRLDESELYGDDPAKMAGFKWMLDVRNAYAAHRHGAFRQCCILAFRDIEKDLSGLGPLVNFYRWPEPSGYAGMLHLMSIALQHIDAKVQRLHDKLFAVVKALTKEEFEAMPVAKGYVLPGGDEAMTRRDLQRARVSGKGPKRTSRTSKRRPSEGTKENDPSQN